MPIPTAESTTAPRRLLRDVVFDRVLAAIVDGTLEPGERLNDDELVRWLQVSRTPVREAVARLHSLGLVEIEANRFTRVAPRDDKTYAEATQVLAGLHRLGVELSSSTLDNKSREVLGDVLTGISKRIGRKDLSAVGELLDFQGRLVEASGNELLADMERSLRMRVQFLGPREADECNWDAVQKTADSLASALRSAS